MMEVQLIRNATLKIRYANTTILVDPYFAKKFSQPSFGGISRNPIVDLPMEIDEILKEVDMVLLTHLHPDHFDQLAQKVLPKGIPVYCQKSDFEKIVRMGFKKVFVTENSQSFRNINIHAVPAQHGTGSFLQVMGEVTGYVLTSPEEDTVYLTGDTILTKDVEVTIRKFQAKVIVANVGGNEFRKEHDIFQLGMKTDSGPVIMNEEQLFQMHLSAPSSILVAVHLGALDHETVSRENLRKIIHENNLGTDKIIVPEDGEKLSFP